MRVLINAVGIEQGGGLTALRGLTKELTASAADHHFILYAGNQLELADLPPGANLEWHQTDVTVWWRRLWWEQIGLRRLLRKHNADVLYSFANYGMFFCPIPQVLCVQNSLFFSESYRKRILRRKPWRDRIEYRLRRRWCLWSVHLADRVLTPSICLQMALQKEKRLPPDKGIAVGFGVQPPVADDGRQLAVKDYNGSIKLLLPVLYTDYKNIGVALKALQLLRDRHGDRFCLVATAGLRTPAARQSVTWREDVALAEELSRIGAIQQAGKLPHKNLLQCYQQCHVMVYPTITEAFGFPLAEALSAGLPVVASEIAVNKELAGEAALYFDPEDPEELARRIEDVVSHEPERKKRAETGRRRARQLNWEKHVRTLVETFKSLLV